MEILSIEAFKVASEDSLEKLNKSIVIRDFKKGRHLFRDKENTENIYAVLDGFVALYKVSDMGEKKVIFILGKGKMVNELMIQDLPSSVSCEIFEDARIASIKKSDLISIMETDFTLTKSILDSMAIKIRRLYRQLKNTSNSLRGDKKLAAKLWKLSGDFGKGVDAGTEIDMNISITYLADMLGSRRETVSKQLKRLSDEGLVVLREGRFIVVDREKLNNYFKSS